MAFSLVKRALPAALGAVILGLSPSPSALAAPADGPAPNLSTYPGALRIEEPKGMGLRYKMPDSWSKETKDGHTLVHQGPPDGPQAFATVVLTNWKNPTPSLPSQGAAQVVSDYLESIRSRGETNEVLREAPFHYVNTGPGVDGTQAVTRFMGPQGPVRQWIVALARADIPVVHVLLFTAPDDLFETALPAAQVMADSLTMAPAKTK